MIRNLNLKDFECYTEKEFKFTPGINIVTGTNHVGKSTIRQAIRYTLTGTPDKKEVSELTRTALDAKCQATLITELADQIHTIFRQPEPNTLKLNGTKLKLGRSADKDGLYEFGYKKNVIEMLCDASNFFERKAEDQRELLVNYFSGDEEIDVTKYGISDENAKEFDGLRLSNVKTFAKNFYDTRTTVNKMIEKTKNEIEINNQNIGAAKFPHTLVDLIIEQEGLEKEIANCKKVVMPLTTPEIEELHAEKQRIKNSSPVGLERFEIKTKEISTKGCANKEKIEGFQKNAGKCPLSGGTVECHEPSLGAFIDALIEENNNLRAEYESIANECEIERKKFNEEKENKLSSIHFKIVAAEADHQTKLKEADEANAETAKRRNELLVKLDGVKMSIHDFDAQAKLKAKNLELANSLPKLEKNSERLTGFINFLEKDLKEKILSGSSSDFFEKINRFSRKFGFDIEAENGDLAKLLINGKTLGMLSTSERIICGISLQLTVAELSGYNFFIADDLESLDPKYLEAIVDLLRDQKEITAILIGLRLFRYLIDGDYQYSFPERTSAILLSELTSAETTEEKIAA